MTGPLEGEVDLRNSILARIDYMEGDDKGEIRLRL